MLARNLQKPSSILVISIHWETQGPSANRVWIDQNSPSRNLILILNCLPPLRHESLQREGTSGTNGASISW
ncbi:hypothetical protein MKW98_011666 [Papaver atlanticum]|uniref:Uncharacterized protein n=1 Tax=Papaver atlanticum TaxID=357466 RepID=A0AAD4S7M1_9MAGN|nr:hypothetical protein MKW98_011666 [Papaver atlanticum]